jgi:hypothetical protein
MGENLDAEVSRINERLRRCSITSEIHKSCVILGLNLDELTIDSVKRAWDTFVPESNKRRYFSKQEAHHAKDTLISWLEYRDSDPSQPSGVPRKPFPIVGNGAIALSLSEPEET